MPKFKWLTGTKPRGGLDALSAELHGFAHYARILAAAQVRAALEAPPAR